MPSQLEQTPHMVLNINRGDAESEGAAQFKINQFSPYTPQSCRLGSGRLISVLSEQAWAIVSRLTSTQQRVSVNVHVLRGHYKTARGECCFPVDVHVLSSPVRLTPISMVGSCIMQVLEMQLPADGRIDPYFDGLKHLA
jgi:hypothetical protein